MKAVVLSAAAETGGVNPILVGVGVFLTLVFGLAVTYAFRNSSNRH